MTGRCWRRHEPNGFEIGWHIDQAGGLWNIDGDELNRHLRRSLHTKDGDYQVPLELVHEALDLE